MKKAGKIILLSLLGLFIFSIFATAFASAQTPAAPTPVQVAQKGYQVATSSSGGFFTSLENVILSWFGTTLNIQTATDQAVTKLLVFMLIFLIILAIADVLPFLEGTTKSKTVLRFLISLIVAYLSVAYVTPQEFYAALTTYSALGVTLTAIIPFAIILTLAWRLTIKPNPANMLTQKLMLGIFAGYLVYKIAALILFKEAYGNVWAYAMIIFIPVLVITVLMLIFNETTRNWILKTKVEGWVEQSKVMDKAQASARIIELRKMIQDLVSQGDTEAATTLTDSLKAMERYAKEAS